MAQPVAKKIYFHHLFPYRPPGRRNVGQIINFKISEVQTLIPCCHLRRRSVTPPWAAWDGLVWDHEYFLHMGELNVDPVPVGVRGHVWLRGYNSPGLEDVRWGSANIDIGEGQSSFLILHRFNMALVHQQDNLLGLMINH